MIRGSNLNIKWKKEKRRRKEKGTRSGVWEKQKHESTIIEQKRKRRKHEREMAWWLCAKENGRGS